MANASSRPGSTACQVVSAITKAELLLRLPIPSQSRLPSSSSSGGGRPPSLLPPPPPAPQQLAPARTPPPLLLLRRRRRQALRRAGSSAVPSPVPPSLLWSSFGQALDPAGDAARSAALPGGPPSAGGQPVGGISEPKPRARCSTAHASGKKTIFLADGASARGRILTAMVAQAFTVDLDKPLVFQVGHLEEQYQDWVHQPIVSKEGGAFFANDVLEFLTRLKWWAVPLIWLPVVCWCLNTSIQMGHTVPEVALMVVAGIFIWTLVESCCIGQTTAHYLLHGCHHKHPMDGLRLVFPPTAAAILCYPFWNFVKLFTTTTTTPGVFGGGLLGYVIYDCTHYYLHHAHPRSIQQNISEIPS
ncbi:hypothetical protein ZWY2020_051075 [Hordeum vulgare]|nr:hypothetical protein ZWY2020_051075 [Hordeum vulgare]